MREREEESMQEEEWMHGRDFWLLNFFLCSSAIFYLCFWEWCVGWSLYMCPFINTPLFVQRSRRVTPCSWLSRVWIMQDAGRRYRGGKRFLSPLVKQAFFCPVAEVYPTVIPLSTWVWVQFPAAVPGLVSGIGTPALSGQQSLLTCSPLKEQCLAPC